MEIKLEKRIKYAGDIHKELMEAGFTSSGAAELLKHVPDAKDVAPVVHAHWIYLDECSNAGVYCSCCQKKVYRGDYANQKLKSKYCPNCGARMDGAK